MDTHHILLVDDEPDLCEMLRVLLTHHRYGVTVCNDGSRAMGVLEGGAFACVMLDLRMPGLEGTELLPIIKHRFPKLPVIIMSAFVDPSTETYCNSLGAFAILIKPFSNDQLLSTISRAVGTTETVPLVLDTLALVEARDRVYRKLIVTALLRTNWNQLKAAKLLGISRYSLTRWLRKFQITCSVPKRRHD